MTSSRSRAQLAWTIEMPHQFRSFNTKSWRYILSQELERMTNTNMRGMWAMLILLVSLQCTFLPCYIDSRILLSTCAAGNETASPEVPRESAKLCPSSEPWESTRSPFGMRSRMRSLASGPNRRGNGHKWNLFLPGVYRRKMFSSSISSVYE